MKQSGLIGSTNPYTETLQRAEEAKKQEVARVKTQKKPRRSSGKPHPTVVYKWM